ncbi:hypothetical protein COB55_01070 [Candidatus Wolfebacteria bacterium]|nr:MAG: hypothetical protein COB55_01070 [Candidatus Wolfebacteria bacterium]
MFNKGLSVPNAIILSAVIVAGSLLMVGRDKNSAGFQAPAVAHQSAAGTQNIELRPVDATDHIFGDPNAPITIIEYSDFECPFCGRFHPTLEQVVRERPNEVRWVYRNFPLTSIHSRARGAAIASECVAKLGGNDAFWQFSDTLFKNHRQLGTKLYESRLEQFGITKEEFSTCVKDPEIARAVDEDTREAAGLGGTGTPFSVIINAKGEATPFSGALPLAHVNSLVDKALTN